MTGKAKARLHFAILKTVILFFCVCMFYPFWYILNQSLSDPILVRQGGAFLLPKGFSLNAYQNVLTTHAMGYGFKNTVFVTVIGTLISLALTLTTAYPLSRSEMPMRKVATGIVVFPLLFSGGMIPTFLIVKGVGLLNSLWALIIPGAIASYNVIIVRSFMCALPVELHEAATIDGANGFSIFFRIVLPLSMPVIATVSLWIAVGHWNNYFGALLYISSREKRVLQQILQEIIDSTSLDNEYTMENPMGVTSETIKAAAIFVTAIPILGVDPFLQKYFTKGVMLGSVKG